MPTLAVLSCVAWWIQPGCRSHRNYERIEKGMELERVQALLDSPGEEISFDGIPGVAPHSKFPDAPDGWLGVVWGGRCYIWQERGRWVGADRTVYVGVSDGRVVSKYLLEHSF
ncbi:MAG: hypothetical protein K2X82_05200 [Gemmataceae bacterium]|nr:hypothetical protein [Gemmataceae bacterium]